MPPRLARAKIPCGWGRAGPSRFWRICEAARRAGSSQRPAAGAGRSRTQPGGAARRLRRLLSPWPRSLPGPSRRRQQRDGTVAPAGHCRSISLHERPAAVPYPQCRLPAPLLPPALPAYLPPVARSLLPRQRPLQPEPPARPAAAAAPGLAGSEAEPGARAPAHAPGAAPPAVGPGSSKGLPAARGPPARPPRAWLRTRRPPDPLLTSRHRGRAGKRPRARGRRERKRGPRSPTPRKGSPPGRPAPGTGLSSAPLFTFSKSAFLLPGGPFEDPPRQPHAKDLKVVESSAGRTMVRRAPSNNACVTIYKSDECHRGRYLPLSATVNCFDYERI